MTTTNRTEPTTELRGQSSPIPLSHPSGPPAPTLAEAQALAASAPGSAFSARIYDAALGRAEKAGQAGRRRSLLSHARGATLELGAGTGLNLEHYPEALPRLVVAEPNAHMVARLQSRVEAGSHSAEVVQAPAELLPYAAASFDTVVSTMVLCTVSDPRQALDEVRRVLRPGGRLLFLEHVRSEHPRKAVWQDRFQKPWAWYADGCRCNQDTLALLRDAEFTVQVTDEAEWSKMPRVVRPLISGIATPA